MTENKFLIALSSLILIALVGYLAFAYFVVKVMPKPLSLNLFIIAMVSGIATFFNPCCFPALFAYVVGIFLRKESKAIRERIVYYGSLAALGVITFNLILGTLTGILG
jgi:cytochrome c biogenesis protein CcdA